jgi:hypothetical protein
VSQPDEQSGVAVVTAMQTSITAVSITGPTAPLDRGVTQQLHQFVGEPRGISHGGILDVHRGEEVKESKQPTQMTGTRTLRLYRGRQKNRLMSSNLPAEIAAAFDSHDSLTTRDGSGVVTTTAFEGTVTADTGEAPTAYTVTVVVPTIESATSGDVGDAVAADWFRTLCRRLEDAPTATRAAIDLDSFEVETREDTVHVEYGFSDTSPARAARIATAFAEFVEGTYVEGIVPGYEYESPVADLLSQASQGEKGGTPL